MASWTSLLRPSRNRVGRSVWLLAVAGVATATCVAFGVELGSRASYVIAGAFGVVAVLLPWWLARRSDG